MMQRWTRIGIVVMAMAAAGCSGGSDGTQDGQQAAVQETGNPASSESPGASSQEVNPILERSLKKDPGPASETAVLKTNRGDIVLRFYPKQAPLAVSNFKGLAAKGYYDGVIFHRVIPDFMAQGGDPTGTGFGGESLWGDTFADEYDPSLRFNRPGLLAMANAGPSTNGSQFFLTLAATPHLNDKHTIFGEVAEGMDVLTTIGGVRTGAGDKPVEPVVIEGIEIQNAGN
jgi:cyclophilin family peptidyl-prolyl cis-trans isomerase